MLLQLSNIFQLQIQNDQSQHPISYSFGLSIINSHVLEGATILLTNNSFFKNILEFPNFGKCDFLSGVPFTFEMLKSRFKMDTPLLKTLTQLWQVK